MKPHALIFLIIALLTVPYGCSRHDGSGMSQKKFFIPKENIRALVTFMGSGFATDEIMVEGKKIGYMYRETPDRKDDSGWRFFSGDESEAYINDPNHIGIYAVNTVANYDPDIIPYLETPAPCAFKKIKGTNRYRRVQQ